MYWNCFETYCREERKSESEGRAAWLASLALAGCMAGGIRLSMHYDNNNSLIDGRTGGRTKGLTDFHSLSFEPRRAAEEEEEVFK